MNKYLLFFIVFISMTGISPGQNSNINYQKLFDENQNNGEVYFQVQNLDLDKISQLVSIDRRENMDKIFAYANEEQFLSLKDKNTKVKMHQHPSTYFKPKMRSDVDIKEISEWDFYPTYDAYIDMMYQFAESYPDICRVEVIGESEEGRSLLACVISDNAQLDPGESQFLYTSTMHGNETAGYIVLLRLIDYFLANYGTNADITHLVNNLEIWINPNANPDGTYASGNNTVYGATRENANGVNLNRNFPIPDSTGNSLPLSKDYQAETLAFMALAENNEFTMSANIHGGAEVCNYPWDMWQGLSPDDEWWQMVCHEYADTAQYYSPAGYMNGFNDGITNGYAWYTIDGGRQDYMNWFHNCSEFTLEMSDVKLIPESQLEAHWEYNYRSLINYMKHAVITGIDEQNISSQNFIVNPNPATDVCNIFYEGIEDIEFNLQMIDRSGKDVLSKNVRLYPKEFYELDIQELKSGLYILKLYNEQISISKKIIKE